MAKRYTVSRTLSTVILFIIIGSLINYIYLKIKPHYFGDLVRAEYNYGLSQFIKDSEVKYNENASFKISSTNYNDAMYYKTINVTPNTPYKVTCMVKTENVIVENEGIGAGAQMCIADTVERSKSITGTNEWQKLEFMFNSKNRTSVDIAFRLGGYDGNCMGTVWFTDFNLELGSVDENTEWNFACFIFDNIDVNLQGENIYLQMSEQDKTKAKQNMERFKTSCRELSGYQMSVNYDIIEIQEPITQVSYDDKNGYYVSPQNVENLIEKYMEEKEYDHIFAVIRMGDATKNVEIPVYDWIGLGGMDYYGIGFSNIRLPNDNNNYIYTYSENINTFPEEVYIHEFLHSLERNLQEYDYDIPALHDYEKYNYASEELVRYKKWYRDYMQCKIENENGELIGLDPIVYTIKPVKKSNFTYSMKVEFINEKDDFISVIKYLWNRNGEEKDTLEAEKNVQKEI